ncbi:hypothetical protein HanRHA438_Chr13g0614801 [Helianthus annuus]|nr:hypothetical protein HanIR_Chr13g0656431 [Helianthus annuus]KAJ0859631.1 hypothetical protein HanRHA438_Chr13g0614801 [Helianthus annuus]
METIGGGTGWMTVVDYGLTSGDCWVLNGVYEDGQRRRRSEMMMVVITGPVFR